MPKATKYLLNLFLFLYLFLSTTQTTFAQSTPLKNLIFQIEIFDKSNSVWKDQTNFFKENQSLAFDNSDNHLKIKLADIDFTHSNSFQYTYRMGSSNPWIQLENNVLEIQNIPHGKSTLEIKSRTSNGEWSENRLTIPIYRQQPFYFRWPFLLGILLGIIALFYFYKKQKAKQEAKIQEAISIVKESLTPVPSEPEKSPLNAIPIQEEEEIIDEFPFDEWQEELKKNANSLIDDGKFSIIELAATMNLSERQFRRKLKQKTGLKPADYMREIRLLKAEYFLKNNTYSTVAEVCYAVGFSTPKHFSKIFKERFGKNPSFYLDNRKSS